MEKVQSVSVPVPSQTGKAPVHIDEHAFTEQWNKFSMAGRESPKENPETEDSQLDEQLIFTLVNPFMHLEVANQQPVALGQPLTDSPINEMETIKSGGILKENAISEPLGEVLESVPEVLEENTAKLDMERQIPIANVVEDNLPTVENEEVVTETSQLTTETIEESIIKESFGNTATITSEAEVESVDSEETVQVKEERPSSVEAKEVEVNIKEPLHVKETLQVKEMLDSEGNKNERPISDSTPEAEKTVKSESTFLARQEVNPILEPFIEVGQKPGPTVGVTKEESLDILKDMVMEKMIDKNGQENFRSTIRLTPESLGEVTVELISTEEGMKGTLVFQTEEAREWMEKEWLTTQLPLETKGITFQSMEFIVSQPAENYLADFSFSHNLSDSQKDQTSQQKKKKKFRAETKEETIEDSPARQVTGLNVYV